MTQGRGVALALASPPSLAASSACGPAQQTTCQPTTDTCKKGSQKVVLEQGDSTLQQLLQRQKGGMFRESISEGSKHMVADAPRPSLEWRTAATCRLLSKALHGNTCLGMRPYQLSVAELRRYTFARRSRFVMPSLWTGASGCSRQAVVTRKSLSHSRS